MNQQNSRSLAMMLLNQQEPIRSDKKPLSKLIFSKFIKISTTKTSKLFGKKLKTQILQAKPQSNKQKTQNVQKSNIILIQEAEERKELHIMEYNLKRNEGNEKQHDSEVKDSLIDRLRESDSYNENNENAQVVSQGASQGKILPSVKRLPQTQYQQMQAQLPKRSSGFKFEETQNNSEPQIESHQRYQIQPLLQPTHDHPDTNLPKPKPKVPEYESPSPKKSCTPLNSQPVQTFSLQPFQTPKSQKYTNFNCTKFETLFSRTIPEEFEEESSKSMISESLGEEIEKREHIDEINQEWRRLSAKSLRIQKDQNEVPNEEIVFKSNLNVKFQNFPSPTDSTSHQTKSLIQKQQKPLKKSHKPHNSDSSLVYVEEEYQNGGKYCGCMKNKQRNGFGRFFYKNGGYYEGMWRNNTMNGQGMLYYDNGKVAYDGQWYQNEFHGRGKVYNDSAKEMSEYFDYRDFNQNIENYWEHYEGNFLHDAGELSHDTKVGFGKIFMSNGEYFEGTFSDDNVHGKGKFYSFRNGGEVIRGVWDHGVLVKVIEITSKRKIEFAVKENGDESQKIVEDQENHGRYNQNEENYSQSVEMVILPDEQKAQPDNTKKMMNEQDQDEIDKESEVLIQEKEEYCIEDPPNQEQQRPKNSIRQMGTVAMSMDLDSNEFNDLACSENLDAINNQEESFSSRTRFNFREISEGKQRPVGVQKEIHHEVQQSNASVSHYNYLFNRSELIEREEIMVRLSPQKKQAADQVGRDVQRQLLSFSEASLHEDQLTQASISNNL